MEAAGGGSILQDIRAPARSIRVIRKPIRRSKMAKGKGKKPPQPKVKKNVAPPPTPTPVKKPAGGKKGK